MPLADYPIRDVDESVSALIAVEWIEGGVPYRDAIDQRGPVTYILYALTFLVAGKHNMLAVHWALLLLIFGGCVLLFRFAAELGGERLSRAHNAASGPPLDLPTGYLAALLLAVCSFTYRRSQMLAFHTEWPVILLSTLGMWWVWRRLKDSETGALPEPKVVGGLFLAGLAFGGAFLSKQPAVFDGAAAGLFLLAWQWRWGKLFYPQTLVRAASLAGGFFAVLGVCLGYFALAGALGDFYLYFWQYNVEHYTAVIPAADRLRALDPFLHRRHYLTANPLLFLACAVALARVISAVFERGRRAINTRLLLVLWLMAAYFGASYSGRNFGHYFIQILAPACLLTALLLRELWLRAGEDDREVSRAWVLARRGLLVALVLLGLGYSLQRFGTDAALVKLRAEPPRAGAQEALVEYVQRATGREDPIFVWGYNPEVYVLAQRRPATRYSNTNYLTGMLPWENHAPEIDTSEHIVDGGWDIFMAELDATPPVLIVDTATGNHRYYSKYPIEDFPRLETYLHQHYLYSTTVRDHRGRPYYNVYRRK
jgi:hypothetical protein